MDFHSTVRLVMCALGTLLLILICYEIVKLVAKKSTKKVKKGALMNLEILSRSEITKKLASYEASQIDYLVSIADPGEGPPKKADRVEKRLCLEFEDSDLDSNPNPPTREHVKKLILFFKDIKKEDKLVIHCFAGIGRSTAAALIFLYLKRPLENLDTLYLELLALRPIAKPNLRMLEHADYLLNTNNRLKSVALRYKNIPKKT